METSAGGTALRATAEAVRAACGDALVAAGDASSDDGLRSALSLIDSA